MKYARIGRQRRSERPRVIAGRCLANAPRVLAGFLGLIHRRVGPRHEVFGIARVIRIDRDAATAGQPQILSLELKAHLRNRPCNALGENFQHLVRDVRHQNREFVAAQAADRVDFPHRALQALGHRHQQAVAGFVAQGVVDLFEAI